MRSQLNQNLIVAAGFVVALIFLLASAGPLVVVGAGYRGVIMNFGQVQDEILNEGLHWRVPIMTEIRQISVRVQKTDILSQVGSKDLQEVKLDVAVNWHVDPAKVNKVYQSIGDEVQVVNRILNPAVGEIIKAAAAKKNAEEILTKRPELKAEIDANLDDRLKVYGIILDGVSLLDVQFTREFADAIEQKQVAEQEAQRAVYIAQKAEREAEAEVNRAKGRAEAQSLIQSTLTPEVLKNKALEAWDGKFPLIYDGSPLPFINVDLLGLQNKSTQSNK
ncbi:prohibitin family protein [Tumidithrix helvetica PCC 7403]|uniref:prohibitin family protein n=1 Tax=Tumidithrix helvetica TaxID=3457545 RepID=UPI003C91C7C9